MDKHILDFGRTHRGRRLGVETPLYKILCPNLKGGWGCGMEVKVIILTSAKINHQFYLEFLIKNFKSLFTPF